jgi:hypothetical protein
MKQLFNAVAVAVPAQQFLIRSFVLLERQVPVMTEFAVRLLHIAGPLDLATLQSYFGLTSNENRELLAVLQAEGLVEEVNGRLSLTTYAAGRFVVSDDSLPRFTRIAERVTRPTFELLSFSPVPRTVSQFWDNTLELNWSGREDGAKSKDLAEEAFHRHFHEIEQFGERDDERNRAFDVYKVTSVAAGKHFNIPVPIYFTVDMDGNVDYEFDQQVEKLGEELMSLVTKMTADRIGRQPRRADHFSAFVGVFGDAVLSRYLKAAPKDSQQVAHSDTSRERISTFDFSHYVREVHGIRGGEVYDNKRSKAVLGVLYLEHNRRQYFESLKEAISRHKASHEGVVAVSEMFWIMPMNDLWGRTRLVQDFVRELAEVWMEQTNCALEVTAVCAQYQSDRPEAARRLAHLLLDAGFTDVLLGPVTPHSERFEVLLCPAIHGAALYEWKVPSSDAMSVPLGFTSSDPEKLDKLLTFVKRCLSYKRHRAYWTDEDMGEQKRLALNELLPGEFLYLDQLGA